MPYETMESRLLSEHHALSAALAASAAAIIALTKLICFVNFIFVTNDSVPVCCCKDFFLSWS